jgi:adenylate kinase
MLNLLMFGAPGTGKGTQSGLLIEKYRLVHFSTGDMLRKAVKEETPVGIEARHFIDQGLLVPDDIILRVVQAEMSKCNNCGGFVFDGFPRTIPQATALDNLLKDFNSPISLVFYLEVDEAELYRRILGRAQTSDRSDDNEVIISRRVEVYRQQTLPLLDYYRSQGKCISIDGMKSIDLVFADITENIDYFLSQKGKGG